MKTIFLIGALVLLAGCASFKTTQTDISKKDTNGIEQRTITTQAKATTFFASKTALTQWKAAQTDKSQSATVGGLAQEADAGTNMTSMAEAIARGFAKGMTKP